VDYLNLNLKDDQIAGALDIDERIIPTEYPIDFINAGLNTLILPIKNLTYCLFISPDQEKLKDFCLTNNIDIILIFTDEVEYASNQYRTRVFAPKFGYLEDPATGSGNAAFGYYLLKHKKWNQDKLCIEQSVNRKNPNIIKLSKTKHKNGYLVMFGGAAIVRVEGDYYLH
jgi:PhzF family phenazine biosynthesis protein